jgi:hypothetical protein
MRDSYDMSGDREQKQPVLPSQLAIAVLPHLIPAVTLPSGAIERALTEPLADGRDEVIYLVCSHPRLKFGERERDGCFPIYAATGVPGGGIAWNASSWWARVELPEHATPSRIPWAIIDTALDWDEHLPFLEGDLSEDPDGSSGQNRQELLPWIYDRHLELEHPSEIERGRVYGGQIDLRVEYVGSSQQDALRRPAGAHHRLPTILGRILLYEPHRLVYLMACEIRLAMFEDEQGDLVRAARLVEVTERHGLDRSTLIACAEDALIAAIAAPYNTRNTGRRRFPSSAAGERLKRLGVRRVKFGFYGLPPRVTLRGSELTWTSETGATVFDLSPHGAS